MVRYTGFTGMARDKKNSHFQVMVSYMAENKDGSKVGELNKEISKYRSIGKSSVSAMLAMTVKYQSLPVIVKIVPKKNKKGTTWKINPALVGFHSKIIAKLAARKLDLEKAYADDNLRPAIDALSLSDKSIKLPKVVTLPEKPIKKKTAPVKKSTKVDKKTAEPVPKEPSIDELLSSFITAVKTELAGFKISVDISFNKET